MKRYLEKILIIFLIFLIVFNFTINGFVIAETDDLIAAVDAEGTFSGENAKYRESFNAIALLLSGLGIIAEAILLLPRMLALVLGFNLQGIISGFLGLGGEETDEEYPDSFFATPDQILFNHYKITDIDFFNINDPDLTDGVKAFRQNVAQFYYIVRLIAISILLIVLVYIGIRMAISTIASEKAMYKKMLVDWVTSLALLFVLQYIMIFIITLNSIIVSTLENLAVGLDMKDVIVAIFTNGLGLGLKPIVSTILFGMIIMQTFIFLLTYIKRMLTVGFLIVISPLITITYSMDKIGDGKAQALNTWMKEFAYNILIQPFHCILYLAIVGSAMAVLDKYALISLGFEAMGQCIFILICIKFLKDGETIIREIFGFKNASSIGNLAAAAGAVAGVLGNSKQIASGIAKTGINMRNSTNKFANRASKIGNKIGNKLGNTEVGKKASEKMNDIKNTVNNNESVKGLKDALSPAKDVLSSTKDALSSAGEKIKGMGIGEGIKKQMGISAGLLAGSMAFQSKGVIDAVAAGALAGQTTDEFMKMTKGTLKNNVQKKLNSTENNNETNDERLNRVYSTGEKGLDSNIKEIERILEEILKKKDGSGASAHLLMYQLNRHQKSDTGKKGDYSQMADEAFSGNDKIGGKGYENLSEAERYDLLNSKINYDYEVETGKIINGQPEKKQIKGSETIRDMMQRYESAIADKDIYKSMKIAESTKIDHKKFINYVCGGESKPSHVYTHKKQTKIPDEIPDEQREILKDIENDGQLLGRNLKNIISGLEGGKLDTGALSTLRTLLNSMNTSVGDSGETIQEPSVASKTTKEVIGDKNITTETVELLEEIDRVEKSGGVDGLSSRVINGSSKKEKLQVLQNAINNCKNQKKRVAAPDYTSVISQLEKAKQDLDKYK